jgi:hypothetical protein
VVERAPEKQKVGKLIPPGIVVWLQPDGACYLGYLGGTLGFDELNKIQEFALKVVRWIEQVSENVFEFTVILYYHQTVGTLVLHKRGSVAREKAYKREKFYAF